MAECSGVFSKEIAFDCSESGFAVARTTLFPLHHKADAAAFIRATGKGVASPSEAVSPRSRLQIKQGWETQLTESDRLGTPISGPIEEARNLSYVHNIVETQRGSTDRTGGEFVATNRLLARLTLRRVRPRHHAIADARKPSCPWLVPCVSPVPVSLPNVSSLFTLRSGSIVGSVHAASPDMLHDPIETLFTELARRRLCSLVAKENS